MVYDSHQVERAVKEYQAGINTEANFTLIYNALVPELMAFFRWKGCDDPEDQKDLTQTVIIRVFEKIGGFKGRSSFKTWVMAIAGHSRIDQWRKQTTDKRRVPPTVSLDETGADNDGKPRLDVVDPQPDPLRVTEIEEQLRILRRAIAILPPQRRRCATLFYLDGLSRSEIAAVLMISEGAVSAHLDQAKQQIIKYMKKFLG